MTKVLILNRKRLTLSLEPPIAVVHFNSFDIRDLFVPSSILDTVLFTFLERRWINRRGRDETI